MRGDKAFRKELCLFSLVHLRAFYRVSIMNVRVYHVAFSLTANSHQNLSKA